ncbi:FAD-dependent oxidoreductase [Adlercreutzia shanghongiae]|uniref:FAD-dependent oxidoreductase n=1 Tax=Adlercreutzia shanghongiae TaxID=3111773 RepID=A0ABU6IY26_9ACTN|nr:FAD-dependent oxidoreductase [Adlercreutzia sp. R22]MEC4294414.1 FAD-dependent oxidoreductase [Adlercreutzia sp. R22]
MKDAGKSTVAQGVSRRGFLCGLGAAGVALGLSGCAPSEAKKGPEESLSETGASDEECLVADSAGNSPDLSTDITYIPQNEELPIPDEPTPSQTEYSCDVLVVGGGLAGLNAAMAAAREGKDVILIDKGTPGYSGLSAWPSCTAYYDPERDCDLETWEKAMVLSCFNFANLNWEMLWCEESKEVFDRLTEWGFIESHERGEDTAYYVDGIMFHDDLRGYNQEFAANNRHVIFEKVLKEAGVTILDHMMLIDVIEDAGTCVGGVALHYRSQTPVTIAAKATVLCTGNGVIKPMGYPVGADTFDGIWIGYQHGLSITGMEFDDFHMTTNYAPTNALMHNSWQYLENIWPTGGTVDAKHMTKRAGVEDRVKSYLEGIDILKYNDNTLMDGAEKAATCSRMCSDYLEQKGIEKAESIHDFDEVDDIRKGKWTSPNPKGHVYGAAVGMVTHLCGGVWCGPDDLEGASGLPGMYVAGDGTNGCMVGGPNYGCQRGSTSSFVSLQGYHAGTAAAHYADGVDAPVLPSAEVEQLVAYTLAPTQVTQGFTPNWVREALHGIMAPGWMTIAKNETMLQAGLTQILELKRKASGKMVAQNGHDLRLAHEVEHQLLAMELKVRAGLERKESRGYHYRTDYPFNDDNWLFYITQTKGDDGNPVIEHVDIPEAWKGDLSASHEERYPTFNTPEEYEKYAPKDKK